jgi:hypothetical protein
VKALQDGIVRATETRGHGTTGAAKLRKKQLQELLQTAPKLG